MKKYKVVKAYVDKYTGADRYTGDVIELDPARAKELKDYVQEVKEKKNGK